MSTHVNKTTGNESEAFQMTKERRLSNYDWPQWMHEAWQKDKNEKGALYCEQGSEENPCTPFFIQAVPEGEVAIEWGDYIIHLGDGAIYSCPQDDFESITRPI